MPTKKSPTHKLRLLLPAVLTLHAACFPAHYLVDPADQTWANRDHLPAVRENDQRPVVLEPRKLFIDRAEPITTPQGVTRLRVTPIRPRGLLISGGVTLAVGGVLMLAGFGSLICPPQTFCENGVSVGSLLGVGSTHVLIGGIMMLAARGQWSPEIKPARR